MDKGMEIGGKEIRVGLDRLVVGLPYPKYPAVSFQDPEGLEQVHLADVQRKEFVAHMKHIESMITSGKFHRAKTKNKDFKRYHVLSELDGSLLCTFLLGFAFGRAVINIELNPSKLSQEQYAEILGLLSVMFDGHYEELFQRGVVSHAEFFIDVPGVELSSLALIAEGRSSTKKYKGTTYHGVRGAPLVVTMYNKAKQLGGSGQLVRIEARINRRDIRFRDLVEENLFNPLSKCFPVEVSVLQSAAKTWKTPQLGNAITELGLHAAIANKHSRKAILTYLKENSATWWEPDSIWAVHRELLLRFRPGQGSVFS